METVSIPPPSHPSEILLRFTAHEGQPGLWGTQNSFSYFKSKMKK